MIVKNTKILFIGPVFHDYHTAIITALEKEGAGVTFFPERKYGTTYKFINNFLPGRLPAYQEKHYNEILEAVKNQQFNILLVIRGFMLPTGFLAKLKAQNPGIRSIMYQWDSNRTNKFLHLVSLFDKVSSFDFEDCEKNKEVSYLPLFYTQDVKAASAQMQNIVYDCFFMGWYLPERYKAIVQFMVYAREKGIRVKPFIFIPTTSFIKEKIKGTKLDPAIVSRKHMLREEYLNILMKSAIVVDVSNKNQTGMAMRIIEALACNKKVLTNNQNLKRDPVYSPGRVAFFDENCPEIPSGFLELPVDTSASKVVYSLEEWLQKLLS